MKKLLIREKFESRVVELQSSKKNKGAFLFIHSPEGGVESQAELTSADLISLKFWIDDKLKEQGIHEC